MFLCISVYEYKNLPQFPVPVEKTHKNPYGFPILKYQSNQPFNTPSHPLHLRPHTTSPPHRHPNLPPLPAQFPCSRPTPPPPSPQPPEIFSSRYSNPPRKKTSHCLPSHPLSLSTAMPIPTPTPKLPPPESRLGLSIIPKLFLFPLFPIPIQARQYFSNHFEFIGFWIAMGRGVGFFWRREQGCWDEERERGACVE